MILLSPTQARSIQWLLTSVADDEWIIGHRGSEWLAETPNLEDDLALSSISQDEMGHAQLLYHLIEGLGGPSPDHQVYDRPIDRWHPAGLVTLPRQDWAEWVTRQYFYEVFDEIRRQALDTIPFPSLSSALLSIQREESYHTRYVHTQIQSLAFGGAVAEDHLAQAIAVDWPFIPSLFTWGGDDSTWQSLQSPVLDPEAMKAAFEATVHQQFVMWNIPWPGALGSIAPQGRDQCHNPAMAQVLSEMATVRHIAPESGW